MGDGVNAMGVTGRRWFTRNVAAIALLSLFSDMGHEMVTSIMPFFVVALGGGSGAVGLIEGVSDLFASLAKIWLPHYSERTGRRKPFLAVGYLLTALKGLMVFATSWAQVLVVRVVAWVGPGARGKRCARAARPCRWSPCHDPRRGNFGRICTPPARRRRPI